ncbi:MAG TPA: hypothetical protein VGG19_19670 [Tepidisphaeraceae bacterium]
MALTGQVDQIGFQNTYRPNCWTPMLVTIHPDGAAGNFLLQVVQEDLDRDRVVYQRPIALSGGTTDQRFWTCFIPEPTDSGLPDPTEGLPALQARLKVFLADSNGKPIAQLQLTQPVIDIDPKSSRMDMQRAKRLILAVSDAGSNDLAPQFNYDDVRGVKEDVSIFPANPSDLPDNPLGYESVDAIILMNVDPAELKAENKFNALVQWVKEGGTLLICQNPQWQKMQSWGDLLPITYPAFGGGGSLMQGSADRDTPGPLPEWDLLTKPTTNPANPFRVAVAQALPAAHEVDHIAWPAGNGKTINTSYLVRQLYGVGTVSWIAVDIGDRRFARMNLYWPRIWDHIFGWNNYTISLPNGNTVQEQQQITAIRALYDYAHGIDLGTAFLASMEHAGRSASLLLIAAIFLGIYWLLAGPGEYLFLLSRKRTRLSWFFFAAIAAAATLLTFIVVKLVLRGPPEVHHISVVRVNSDQKAVVRSGIGLYIPRDNPAEPVELGDTSGDAYITPFPIHPQQMKANSFAGYMQYAVNVRDVTDETPPLIRVPYRSTLKKLQAKWLGTQPIIEGPPPQLLPPSKGYIAGQLTNGTNHPLQDIFILFHYPSTEPASNGDWGLYLPSWRTGDSVDLRQTFAAAKILDMVNEPRTVPGQNMIIKGRIGRGKIQLDWDRWWYNGLQGGTEEADYPQGDDPYTAFVMASLFERLPTPQTHTNQPRFELQRRGARNMDASNILAAGGMLILARTEGPLPFPLEVSGQAIGGSGDIYYQMILPLDQTQLAPLQTTTAP